MRGWFRDPAVWAWGLAGLMALLPLKAALGQIVPSMPDVDDLPPMIGMPAMAPVKKLADNDLDCEQIYVEVSALEKTNAARQAEVDAATKSITDAAQSMANAGMAAGTMATGMGIVSGLAGLVPGAGMITGMVGSAATAATMAQMQSQQTAMMGSQQRLMKVAQEHAWGSARAEHLTELFLKRGCKLSEVKAALAARDKARTARPQVADGESEGAPKPVASN